MSKADRRSFLGPWCSRSSRHATQKVLAGVLEIDLMMAGIQRLVGTELGHLPVLTVFGRRNDPYGWQSRFEQSFPDATAVGIAGGRHFPFADDPDAYSAAISAWWAEKVAPISLPGTHRLTVARESDR